LLSASAGPATSSLPLAFRYRRQPVVCQVLGLIAATPSNIGELAGPTQELQAALATLPGNTDVAQGTLRQPELLFASSVGRDARRLEL